MAGRVCLMNAPNYSYLLERLAKSLEQHKNKIKQVTSKLFSLSTVPWPLLSQVYTRPYTYTPAPHPHSHPLRNLLWKTPDRAKLPPQPLMNDPKAPWWWHCLFKQPSWWYWVNYKLHPSNNSFHTEDCCRQELVGFKFSIFTTWKKVRFLSYLLTGLWTGQV